MKNLKFFIICTFILIISSHYVFSTEKEISDTIWLKSSENPKNYTINGNTYSVDYTYANYFKGFAHFVINGDTKKINLSETIELNSNVRFRLDAITEAPYINTATFTFIVISECGNGVCGSDETCSSCVQDCGCKSGYSCQSNQCVEQVRCGDDYCSPTETCAEDNCCNGKEIAIKSDNENCGGCGKKCNEGFRCENSECVPNVIDLSYYPSFLIKDGRFDLTTVVGDKSSSINVIAQTYILPTFLSAEFIKNKLASEITSLNQNIISFGNPCINEISAKIMGNPQPCDKDFQRGKGYIKLYRYDDFFHLIIAGYTDLGTKKAAEILANYQNYKFQGNEYVIEFSGDTGDRLVEEKKESTKTQVPEQEQSKEIEIEIETEAEPKTDTQTIAKVEQKAIEEQKAEGKIEPKMEEQNQTEKSGNIINKFISWFLSLFRK